MRVSTGTILDYPLASKLPPIALIIWTPFPSPAIFEVGDFALVPKSSAFGLIEVKRSNYPETETAFEAFFESARGMISAPAGSRTVLGSCLSLKKILAID
jgi:hypothetical protein